MNELMYWPYKVTMIQDFLTWIKNEHSCARTQLQISNEMITQSARRFFSIVIPSDFLEMTDSWFSFHLHQLSPPRNIELIIQLYQC